MSSQETDHRLIAVEEHFATDSYFDGLESLDVPDAEKAKHAFFLGFPETGEMRPKSPSRGP